MAARRKFELFPKRFGVFPLVFLLYLAFPLTSMTEQHGVKMVLGYAMLLVFIVSYRQLYYAIGHRMKYAIWLGLQMFIVFILSVFYAETYVLMGFFAANFVGQYRNTRPFRIAMITFAIVCIAPIVVNFQNLINNKGSLMMAPMFIVMLVSPFGIRSAMKYQDLERKLDQANEQIKQLVKRDERMRIARDLHDTLGHTLSLITLKSQLVTKLIDKDPKRAQNEAAEIERTSRSTLKQVRELVSEMRATTVAEELIDAEAILSSAQIKLIVKGETELRDVPALTQNIMSMCLRELITNVVKHSEATICTIKLIHTEGTIGIVVQDNGKGISTQVLEGNGLAGMRERLAFIEGELQLAPNASHTGTVVSIIIPVVIKEPLEGVV
ncbi:sensor histidine kinase [Paenibacillus sp. N1-5-1-14]|uniref:sensor histidine kinase n=1 Tax=Paenibacillus radicibacter TaxID=2972488 RepID=UPI002158BC21|nr:sensor histidine kinase [Paenibacillus radicibacter]MCR8645110.1 sensor histidine kinase [Paenibacillus radicibacter]